MSRRPAIVLFIVTAIIDLSTRAALIAMPLVVLAETQSVSLTGVTSGAMAAPLILSPWWARRLRPAVARSSVLAATTIVESAGAVVVPLAALGGFLTPGVLVFAGLLSGTARTLTLPGRQALLADLEQHRTGSAVRILAGQEAVSRATGIAGPLLGALVVAVGGGVVLLLGEAATIAFCAVLTLAVRQGSSATNEEQVPGLLHALRGHPEIRAGWIIRATAGLTWFAFSLGLSVQGELRDRPGYFSAIGLTAYAIGAVGSTLVAGRVAWIRPSLTLAASGWLINGASWMLMGVWPHEFGYGIGGLAGGAGAAVGFATITRLIGERTHGNARRALLAGQLIVVESGTALGMFAGGEVIARCGVDNTFVLTGLALSTVALVPLITQCFARLRRIAAREEQ